jgi:hypothetical protein
MSETTSSVRLKNLDPRAFEQVSKLYDALRAHVHTAHSVGPALESLDDFCELYLTILPDSKDHARIKVAAFEDGEIWLSFYAPESVEGVGLELVRKKDRGPHGVQVSRWALVNAARLDALGQKQREGLFSGYDR